MFEEYRRIVLQAYHDKNASGLLNGNLTVPTPGSLRNECDALYYQNPTPHIERIFRSFERQKNKETDHFLDIGKIDADRFKPLLNFIQGKTVRPSNHNVELLAWLIDFQPRPYAEWRMGTCKLTQAKTIALAKPKENLVAEVKRQVIDKRKWINPLKKIKEIKVVGAKLPMFVLFSLIIGCFYLFLKKQQDLYWIGNHYEISAYDVNRDGASIMTPEHAVNLRYDTVGRPQVLLLKLDRALEKREELMRKQLFTKDFTVNSDTLYYRHISVRPIELNLQKY